MRKGNMKKILFILISVLLVTFSLSQAEPEHLGQAGAKAKHDPGSLFPQPKPNKSKTTPPPATELMEPAFMAKINGNTVKLKWSSVAGAENYHLQIATDPNFKWLTLDNHYQKTISYDVTDLSPGKTYYWRVAAVRNSNDATYIKGDFVKSMFEVMK